MPKIVLLLAFLLAATISAMAAVSCGSFSGPGSGGGTGTESANTTDEPVNNPFGIYSPGNLDEVPMASKQQIIDALGVGSYENYQDTVIGMMREVGVKWARVDIWHSGLRFEDRPDYLERLRAAGFEVVVCARPRDNFAPADLAPFQEDMRELVGRYPWIKTWQIGNEPNISLDNPDAYSRIFFAGRQAIYDVCPDCRVMLAGVALRYPTEGQAKEIYRRILSSMAAQTDGKLPFDIFDFHFYGLAGQDSVLLSNLNDYRRIIRESGFDDSQVEFWLTECAIHTGKVIEPVTTPVQTEDDQAAELIRRFVTGLAGGMTRVSWARPYENYRYGGFPEDSYFDLTALVYNGLGQESTRGIPAGTKKKSWYAYRTLVSKMSGYSEARMLAPGVYEISFNSGRKPLYVIWDAGTGTATGMILPEDARGEVTVTDMMGNENGLQTDALVPGRNPVFVERI